MAQSFDRRSSRQNPQNGKDKHAGKISTKGSNRCTLATAVTCTPIPTAALIVAPLAAFGSADSSMVKYWEDNLQWILKTVLDSRLFALIPAPVLAAAPHYEGLCERLLKVWFLDIY